MSDRDTLAWAWWAETIVLAVIDEDDTSRRQLAEATGDPEAWRIFGRVKWDAESPGGHPEDVIAETFARSPKALMTWTRPARFPARLVTIRRSVLWLSTSCGSSGVL